MDTIKKNINKKDISKTTNDSLISNAVALSMKKNHELITKMLDNNLFNTFANKKIDLAKKVNDFINSFEKIDFDLFFEDAIAYAEKVLNELDNLYIDLSHQINSNCTFLLNKNIDSKDQIQSLKTKYFNNQEDLKNINLDSIKANSLKKSNDKLNDDIVKLNRDIDLVTVEINKLIDLQHNLDHHIYICVNKLQSKHYFLCDIYESMDEIIESSCEFIADKEFIKQKYSKYSKELNSITDFCNHKIKPEKISKSLDHQIANKLDNNIFVVKSTSKPQNIVKKIKSSSIKK